MRYLEEIFNVYMEQKKNPVPDLNVNLNDIGNTSINDFPKQEKKELEQSLEFGEIYYLIDKRGIPIFFMINGLVEESKNRLYSVYKVSDFTEFATQEDFLIELNNLPYMVETWNEFYIYEDMIKDALFIGKIPLEDLYILQDVLDGLSEIPQEKRGLTILEEGNYIQHKFQQEELKDVEPYKALVFEIFEDIEEQQEIEFLEELLSKSLEDVEVPEYAYASEEETYAERDNFMILKEDDVLIIRVTNEGIIGREGVIKIFNKEIKATIPEEIKIKLPEKLKNADIEYLADNIVIEVD